MERKAVRRPEQLLRHVSRSFFLSLRALPARVRGPVGLAYLLARAADTIADTALVGAEERLAALRSLREAIRRACRAEPVPPLELSILGKAQPGPAGTGNHAERALLGAVPGLLAELGELEAGDRASTGKVLDSITRGQEGDLERFGGGSLSALETDEELDTYTYLVAGCVGEFWNNMCRRHLYPAAALDDAYLERSAVRFGKGLQMVNVLRDIPGDLRQGRCYVPERRLEAAGLSPADLMDRSAMGRFRPLFQGYVDLAMGHLEAGWCYTLALPAAQLRIRLACAWPLLIGARTLALLRPAEILDGGVRIKVPRAEVRSWILRSAALYPLQPLWKGLFARAAAGCGGIPADLRPRAF